jgi:hypothetical protein
MSTPFDEIRHKRFQGEMLSAIETIICWAEEDGSLDYAEQSAGELEKLKNIEAAAMETLEAFGPNLAVTSHIRQRDALHSLAQAFGINYNDISDGLYNQNKTPNGPE